MHVLNYSDAYECMCLIILMPESAHNLVSGGDHSDLLPHCLVDVLTFKHTLTHTHTQTNTHRAVRSLRSAA